jgi:hypothetical protein
MPSGFFGQSSFFPEFRWGPPGKKISSPLMKHVSIQELLQSKRLVRQTSSFNMDSRPEVKLGERLQISTGISFEEVIR